MTVFSITDNMAHVFWTFADPAHPNFYRPEAEQYREAFYASYERCDELLGALMEIAGPRTTTVVISDHGFGSVRPRQYLFQRLLEGGYLQVANRRDKQGGLREWILKAAVRTYSRFPIIREWVKALSPGRRRSLQRTLHKAGAMPDRSAVDHAASKVILSDFGLQIWINEVGRFPHGIIRKEARAKFIEDLVDFLLSDRDPVTGERIVERVHLGRDVYEGPYVDDCPDLIVEYKNHFGMAGTSGRRNGFTEGGHTHDGIFLASGPAIANHNAGNAHLMDLAPTILYLLGLAVPKDMDGRMLEEIFSERFLRDNPLQMSQQAAVFEEILPGTPYSDEQDAELRNQLRQLGYL